MTTFHELRIRQRKLLDDLDELETSVAELTVILSEAVETESDEFMDQREQLAWLRRQHTGVQAILSETERALLEFDVDGWDE
jgi:hypothetical protein